jgi:hypothetical protein
MCVERKKEDNRRGGQQEMTRKIPALGLAMASMLIFAGLALASTKEVSVSYPAKLTSGQELQPGSYKVEVLNTQSTPEVVFYKGKEVVARTPVKLVEQPKKSDRTMITYNTQENTRIIDEIWLAGWKEKLVFEKAEVTTQSGQ